MLRVIDRTTGETFDLTPGTKISVDLTNPFLTDQGSISLTLALPYTPKNLRLLNFPQRIDRSELLTRKLEVIIQCNSYQQIATLKLTKVSETEITSVLLINESAFYLAAQNVTVNTVFAGITRADFTGTVTEQIVQWLNYLELVGIGDVVDSELAIFPVTQKFKKESDPPTEENYTLWVNNILNGLDVDNIKTSAASGNYYALLSAKSRTVTIDSTTITYPVGYYVSPFLKVNYVLTQIFNYFGYTLDTSTLPADFASLVILNNTKDALMNGYLKYSQLVPTCTVSAFIESLMNMFSLVFVLNQSEKTCKCVFMKDLIAGPFNNDYTPYKTSKLTFDELEKLKSLKLTADKYNLYSTDYESIQQIIAAYGNFTELDYYPLSEIYTQPLVPGLYYLKNREVLMSVVAANNDAGILWTFIASSADLNYFEDSIESSDDYEYLEKSAGAQHIPIVSAHFGPKIPITDGSISYPLEMCIPYFENLRILNSNILLSDGTVTTADKEGNTTCPIMFCFLGGRADRDPLIDVTYSTNYLSHGTTSAYNNMGIKKRDFSLSYFGADGLYNKFWAEFDNLIHKSWYPVKVDLNLPDYFMNDFNMLEPPLIDGQPLLPEEIKYELSDSGIKIVDTKFRTLKKYAD